MTQERVMQSVNLGRTDLAHERKIYDLLLADCHVLINRGYWQIHNNRK